MSKCVYIYPKRFFFMFLQRALCHTRLLRLLRVGVNAGGRRCLLLVCRSTKTLCEDDALHDSSYCVAGDSASHDPIAEYVDVGTYLGYVLPLKMLKLCRIGLSIRYRVYPCLKRLEGTALGESVRVVGMPSYPTYLHSREV